MKEAPINVYSNRNKEDEKQTTQDTEKHECTLGYFFDYDDSRMMDLDDMVEQAESDREDFETFVKGDDSPYHWTKFSPFKFCPYCGKPIDWEQTIERGKAEMEFRENTRHEHEKEKME